MKTICIVLVLFFHATVASFVSHDIASSIYKNFKRIKRDVGDESFDCAASCLNEGSKQMKKLKKSREETVPLVCHWHEPALFEGSCVAYTVSTECLKECADGELKTFAVNAMKSLEFVCAVRYNEFKENLPCIYSTCDKIEETCDTKCEAYKVNASDISYAIKEADTIRGGTNEIAHLICRHMNCTNNCVLPEIQEACGSTAFDLERELINETMRAVELILSSILEFEVRLPDECYRRD